MAYIGNIPAESYASFETETFSVSATANYTLSHAVTNENEIRLVINGVVQQPGSGKAYTASGTTLTLSSATVSGDVMYAVYLGRALQTVNPPNASVGNSQTAPTIITGQTAETSIATDDTILIHDTSASALRKMTRANFVSGIGGTNTPAFMANLASGQSISNGTATKVNMSTEIFDTDSKYDNSSYKFTPTVAGKYFVYAQIMLTAYGADGTPAGLQIRKNGSTIHESYERSAQNNNFDFYIHISATVVLDDDDYIEIFAYQDSGSSKTIYQGSLYSFWGSHKLIGV
jgi:hypothetical protein